MTTRLFKPSIKRKDMDAVLRCLVSDELTGGRICDDFIKDICTLTFNKFGMAFREYKRAVEIAVDSFGLLPGDRVIISIFSPSVYFDVLVSRGLEPVLIDTEPDLPCIDLAKAEKALDNRVKLICLSSPYGIITDIKVIGEFRLPILEDITQSFGIRGVKREYSEDGFCYVLATEEEGIFTTGGGALLLTGDKTIEKRLKDDTGQIEKSSLLPNMNAALGIQQLKALEGFLKIRNEIAVLYTNALAKTRHRPLIQRYSDSIPIYSFIVLVSGSTIDVIKYASKYGIETRKAFCDTIAARRSDLLDEFPHASRLLSRCILFPLYPSIGKRNIENVLKVLSTLP